MAYNRGMSDEDPVHDGKCRDGAARDEAARDEVARPPVTASLIESPWLWACVFLCGALVALQLTGPKFSWRQPQIERQFQARERSGSSMPRGQRTKEYSRTGRPLLTLRPLFLMTGVGLIVAYGMFWWYHVRRAGP